MTNHNLSHWTIENGRNGLLLFAQAMEELTSMQSHDSHKVPVFNFHFICYEVLTVVGLIEKGVLDKGSLPILLTEMESLFNSDDIAKSILGDSFNALFISRTAKGDYDENNYENKILKDSEKKDSEKKDSENGMGLLKETLRFIIDELEIDDHYYKILISRIRDSITASNSMEHLDAILPYTKIFASELINRNYHQAYIHEQTLSIFFNDSSAVDSIEVFDNFLSSFPMAQKEYVIYLPITGFKQKKALEAYPVFQFADNILDMFDPNIPYILKYKNRSVDPYQAREEALHVINFCLSINQFINHTSYSFSQKNAQVVDVETKTEYTLKKTPTPITCGYGNGDELDRNDLLSGLNSSSTIQILQLHSAALTSKDTGNQLINLWSAVEVAVPTIKKGSHSRIVQISNILSTILSKNYFSILLHQLYLDIKKCVPEVIPLLDNIEYGDTAEQKLLAMIILPEFTDYYSQAGELLLQSSPLLLCRIRCYEVQWSSTQNILSCYKKHTNRLIQQIMRIYRTRNMLIHDGSPMPYCDLVLQNLHYYIDSYVAYIVQSVSNGYHSVGSSIIAAQLNEQHYLKSLKNNSNTQQTDILKYIIGH